MKQTSTDEILGRLTDAYSGLSPQLRRAADYVLHNPNEVGVHSMRRIAASADVNPNTLVRLARAVGFESYQSFREPFSQRLSKGGEDFFPDRARWLQSLAQGGSEGLLYRDMAATTLANVEQMFSGTTPDELKRVAELIVASPDTYIMGVGSAHSLAHLFWYVARMALDTLHEVPRQGNLPIDDLANIHKGDVLLAMTFSPYRADVVEAVALARDRGATIVAISDSRTSPIALKADHVFVTPTNTPQFFPSLSSGFALIETLLAFVIAHAGEPAIENINRFHRARYRAGIYTSGDWGSADRGAEPNSSSESNAPNESNA